MSAGSLAKPPTRSLLARVLDEPGLVTAVRQLPPVSLAAVVREVGLEDAAEIVALATPEQLTRVLDEDVWKVTEEGDGFDADRFALWLEVLREAGERELARKLAGLPEVTAHSLRGLHSTLATEHGSTGHTVAAALGHTSYTTTQKHYVQPGTVERVARRRVQELLDDSPEQPHA